ncbi:hypothetical protein J7E73_06450 [Paenibacillus albidus]|nr:hypothetical protein [Paenibacillus albidus]
MIELFFKWMKQHLRLIRVFSYSPTGIWNQLYLALIAFALCTLIRSAQADSCIRAWELGTSRECPESTPYPTFEPSQSVLDVQNIVEPQSSLPDTAPWKTGVTPSPSLARCKMRP